ncbi:unnamed protein product [Urochloa decumbens]|uniref:Uncharacterized protein n=1 Tax=Urochloa decumbens TaxID=240449 RepID=A0ABC9EFT9_9POAL
MSFRRFVNLITNDCAQNTYALRRIDMSRFFKNENVSSLLGLDPPPVKDCCLPDVMMNFYPPQREDSGIMEFMRVKNKVVATDQKCGACMYEPEMHAVRTLPRFVKPKNWPISIAMGNNLFVLDRAPNGNSTRNFEALVYDAPSPHRQGDWDWHALPSMPPPPCARNGNEDPTWADSCAAVEGGSHIWISATGGDAANAWTYSFDTQRLVWSKPADWTLPFCGIAEYIPELHKLWFGIASRDHGRVFCASDLAAASFSQEDRRPPVLHTVFDDMAGFSKEWRLVTAHAVHLGSGKFCIARFFDRSRPRSEDTPVHYEVKENCVVFAGVEVVSLEGKLHMVKHNSERYMLVDQELQWVL